MNKLTVAPISYTKKDLETIKYSLDIWIEDLYEWNKHNNNEKLSIAEELREAANKL